jgi:hypothetical protein
MAIEKLLINSEGQLAGLRRLTAKPAPARIFRGRATGRKPAPATRVPADSPALAIVEAAEQAIVEAAVQTAVAGEPIA